MSKQALSGLVESINERMRHLMEVQQQGHQNLLQHQALAHQNLIERLTQPKQVVRDENGKIIGVK
jgi:uncharacterized protein YdbL (DUF1318 family)